MGTAGAAVIPSMSAAQEAGVSVARGRAIQELAASPLSSRGKRGILRFPTRELSIGTMTMPRFARDDKKDKENIDA